MPSNKINYCYGLTKLIQIDSLIKNTCDCISDEYDDPEPLHIKYLAFGEDGSILLIDSHDKQSIFDLDLEDEDSDVASEDDI